MQQMKLYEEMLLQRKKEINGILKNLKEEFNDVSKCDIKEDADFASCSSNSENNYYLYQKLNNELNEIEDALQDIKNGKYGICQMCEEEINPERLKIKPFAKYCIDCREIIEKERKIG